MKNKNETMCIKNFKIGFVKRNKTKSCVFYDWLNFINLLLSGADDDDRIWCLMLMWEI